MKKLDLVTLKNLEQIAWIRAWDQHIQYVN